MLPQRRPSLLSPFRMQRATIQAALHAAAGHAHRTSASCTNAAHVAWLSAAVSHAVYDAQVHISYLEIYNNEGYDLLDADREVKAMEDLAQVGGAGASGGDWGWVWGWEGTCKRHACPPDPDGVEERRGRVQEDLAQVCVHIGTILGAKP